MKTKITQMDAYPHSCAMKTMVMHSDFDLLSSLDSLLHKFPTKTDIQWVASHQNNDTKDISTLSLAAQLNIHAYKDLLDNQTQ